MIDAIELEQVASNAKSNVLLRALQSEYDELKQAHADHLKRSSFVSDITDDVIGESGQNGGGGEAEMVAEARLLRQHKGRLEARMKVLEEHNEQLDSQLKRLRQLLNSDEAVCVLGFVMSLKCY